MDAKQKEYITSCWLFFFKRCFEKKILARPTVGFVSLLETSAELLRSLNRLYSEIETAARSD